MTADRLAQDAGPIRRTERRAVFRPDDPLMCDRLLGRGRGAAATCSRGCARPAPAAGEWLPVDAYYPRARLVVMCRAAGEPHEGLYRELVPAHGLGLLRLDPDAPGGTTRAPSRRRWRPTDLRPRAPPRPARPQDGPPDAAARAEPGSPVKDVGAERAGVDPGQGSAYVGPAGLSSRALGHARRARARPSSLIAEVYLGVVQLAFGAGRVMLGLAIATRGVARAPSGRSPRRAPGERTWAVRAARSAARRSWPGSRCPAAVRPRPRSSRRRWPGCWPALAARRRRAGAAPRALRARASPIASAQWTPSPKNRSSFTATLRGARCSLLCARPPRRRPRRRDRRAGDPGRRRQRRRGWVAAAVLIVFSSYARVGARAPDGTTYTITTGA